MRIRRSIEIRSERELSLLNTLAAAHGQSLSNFVRSLLTEAARTKTGRKAMKEAGEKGAVEFPPILSTGHKPKRGNRYCLPCRGQNRERLATHHGYCEECYIAGLEAAAVM